jgi:MFS transporter, MHS family, proline/betaine transporter
MSEHYDNSLFAFLVPFISNLFFSPTTPPFFALVYGYLILPIGLLARPIGAYFFGKTEKLYGRKITLILAMTGVIVSTSIIAIIPTYAKIQYLSTLSLILCRFCQNFCFSTEIIGSAILLLDNSSSRKKSFISSLYDTFSVFGILLASSLVSLLGCYNMIEKLWRYLYVFGAILTFISLLLRVYSPSFIFTADNIKKHYISKIDFKLLRKQFLVIVIISGFTYMNYSLTFIFMSGFIPLVTNLTSTTILLTTPYLLLLDILLLPLFGYLSHVVSKENIMIISSIMAIIFYPILFLSLKNADIITVIIVRCCFVIIGASFAAPFHYFIQQIIPHHLRFTIITFAYAIGSRLIGSPSCVIFLWLYHASSHVASPCIFTVLISFISLLAILFVKKEKASSPELLLQKKQL